MALAGLKTPVQSLHRDSPNLKTDSIIGTIVFVASIFCTDIFITVPEKIFKSPDENVNFSQTENPIITFYVCRGAAYSNVCGVIEFLIC